MLRQRRLVNNPGLCVIYMDMLGGKSEVHINVRIADWISQLKQFAKYHFLVT